MTRSLQENTPEVHMFGSFCTLPSRYSNCHTRYNRQSKHSLKQSQDALEPIRIVEDNVQRLLPLSAFGVSSMLTPTGVFFFENESQIVVLATKPARKGRWRGRRRISS